MSIDLTKLNTMKSQIPAGYWLVENVFKFREILTFDSFLKTQFESWYWSNRIISQIEYASKLSKTFQGKLDKVIDESLDFLFDNYKNDKVITKKVVLKTEQMLSSLSSIAKSFKILCAAHAHIDMNWMWRYDETVSVVLETFRTVLKLMNEYENFKFSQSQASVYKILEEYAPDMLDEVKKRIKEGKWEVTASTWVEHDKNMPNSESMIRQILYAKKYLSCLLEIDSKNLKIDFEPDTFGHSINVPEILSSGGIKYYYHCRGKAEDIIYKWIAPSGNYVITYREPFWYNSVIDSSIAMYVPEFCSKYNIDTMLKVYGVGDHGGGPTRQDIERIIDMNSWPIFPQIHFGTFLEYFTLIESIADNLPMVNRELNFIFTGCYTSQSKIKLANSAAESTLNEAETFDSILSLLNSSKGHSEKFAKSWEKVLFNQFHDILPGSCTVDSREYALGLFQQSMAISNTLRSDALRLIANKIDTLPLAVKDEIVIENTSEGAGVGYGVENFKIMQSESGKGKKRIFHIFNSASFERNEVVELTIWDWSGDIEKIVVTNEKGDNIPQQLVDHCFQSYWGHTYFRLLVTVRVPSFGYSTIVVDEFLDVEVNSFLERLSSLFNPRTEKVNKFVLENNFIKVTFNPENASIMSLIDKESNKDFISKTQPVGFFRVIYEDASKGGTAWVVGRYMNIDNLLKNVKIKDIKTNQIVRESFTYELKYRNSELKVDIFLNKNSYTLEYEVECDWQEIGKPGDRTPQLAFYFPLSYANNGFKYDVPFGVIKREGIDMDVPANSFAVGVNKDITNKSVMFITDAKHGFRCNDEGMSITLLRSSSDPDLYPEIGKHKFRFAISFVDANSNKELIEKSYAFNHPFNCLSGSFHGGSFPLDFSFLNLENSNVVISGIKTPENEESHKLIIHLYEVEGKNNIVEFNFFKQIYDAYFIDINETKIKEPRQKIIVSGNSVTFEVRPYEITNICIVFQ